MSLPVLSTTCSTTTQPDNDRIAAALADQKALQEFLQALADCQQQPQHTYFDEAKSPRLEMNVKGETVYFRPLHRDDYNRQYLHLLGQLTKVGSSTKEEWDTQYDRIFPHTGPTNTTILVAECPTTGVIVGTGTLLCEHKFIRSMGAVGHIEDIVVHETWRHNKLGSVIVDMLSTLSQMLGHYKTILDCSEDTRVFYEKMGYTPHGLQMSKYH